MRARLALVLSQTPCELREVILRHKPAELLQVSPKGTVPVLITPQSEVIEQSLDIMTWALGRHDPGRFLPRSSDDERLARALILRNDSEFKFNLDRYKYPERYQGQADFTSAAEFALSHRSRAAAILDELNQGLGASAYLLGNYASLADLAIAPFVRQFAHTDKRWFLGQDWQPLQAWLDAWLDSALWEQVMARFPAWVNGAEPCEFPA